MYTETFYL